jgi:HEAT repeat protein
VLIHDLLPLFAGLAADDQDSVRHLTVADLIAIAQQLNPQETQELLGTGIRNLWADKSWRVRYSVADNWVALAVSVGGEHAGEELVAAFVRLVKDNEAEVRSAIAKQIPGNFSHNDAFHADFQDFVNWCLWTLFLGKFSLRSRNLLGIQILKSEPRSEKISVVSLPFSVKIPPSNISYPCSSKCSKTTTPKSVSTSSLV